MKRAVISWVAVGNDFDREGRFDMTGPSYRYHENFYEPLQYDKHFIVTSDSEKVELSSGVRLMSELKKHFKHHNFEVIYADLVGSEVVEFNLLYAKIFNVIKELSDYYLDLFISPGTPTMQMVWHYINQAFKERTRLIQTIRPEQTPDRKAKLIEVTIGANPLADYSIYTEKVGVKGIVPAGFCETETTKKLLTKAEGLAQTDNVTILVLGKTGVGKESIVNHIHNSSKRGSKKMVSVICSAFGTSELLESRLFGYVKGAFTGAEKDTNGYFAEAHGSTIFLDEIGDISLQTQQTLLRVLQSGEIQKVGSPVIEKVDVRVIVATNKDLLKLCAEGKFLYDLFYRLQVTDIEIPSLKERGKAEIETLIYFFIEDCFKRVAIRKEKITIQKELMDFLLNYSWPGNIRQLENLIMRFYANNIQNPGLTDLPSYYMNEATNTESLKLDDVIVAHARKVYLLENSNARQTAIKLGITENTLKKYLNLNYA